MTSLAVKPAHRPGDLGDHTSIGWSRKFVYELAMRLGTPREICQVHGITAQEWDALRVNPVFVADLKRAQDEMKAEGATFRVKAEMISEAFLDKAYEMVHAGHDIVAPSVKRDLIRDMVKHAGLDASKDQDAQVKGAPMLAIQINLS